MVSRTHDRLYRFNTAARNALMLAGFLFFAALIIRYTLVPDIPPVSVMPTADPDDSDLFTADMPWLVGTTDLGRMVPDPLSATATIETRPLLEWRRHMGPGRLRSVGIDPAVLHRLQLTLLSHQNADGSFAGSDVLAATGLATLALQAVPLPPAGEDHDRLVAALQKATRWLSVRVHNPSGQRHTSLGRTLATLAVLEDDALGAAERHAIIVRAMDRETPIWQAITLLSCPPDERPPEAVDALNAALGNDHIARVLGSLLDHRQTVTLELDDAAFTSEAARDAVGVQGLAWALAAWYRGAAPRVMHEQLVTWAHTGAFPADAALFGAAPLIAEPALAILAASAPIRAPVSWAALP